MYRVINFNWLISDWLKPYIDINTEIRKKAKKDFEKYFFNLMNNAIFGKTVENLRLMKDELGGKIMKEFAALRAKTAI